MARIYYGVANGYTGSVKKQMLICDKPIYYLGHNIYFFNTDGCLYIKSDLEFCNDTFPAIKISLAKSHKYVSLTSYSTMHNNKEYDQIQYVIDCIQLHDGVANHHWGGQFRAKLKNTAEGTHITEISDEYSDITFEDVPDEQVECKETEKFIKYLADTISENEEDIKFAQSTPSRVIEKTLYKLDAEQNNRKVLLGALTCKLEFNGRRTWAPYITKDDNKINREKLGINRKRYIKQKSSSEDDEVGRKTRGKYEVDEVAKYSDIDKLKLTDFILLINHPTFDRYQDGYPMSRGIDHIEIELSIRSVGLTYDKQVECFKKFMRDIDKLVASRICSHMTFKSSGLKLSYFKVERSLTHQSLIIYTMNLKDEYKKIKQGKILADTVQKRREYTDELDTYI